jgi:hypothetical protein
VILNDQAENGMQRGGISIDQAIETASGAQAK